MTIALAVDCMGGDHGLSSTLPAAIAFLKRVPDATLLLVGDGSAIASELKRRGAATDPRLEIVHASEIIGMDDPIEVALRKKKDSSMRVAVNLVKEGRARAAVSAGNTGALMAISRYLLKTLDGIDRPAIAMGLPNQQGGVTTMLDLGANVDCQPVHLLQFAVMGSALAAVDGKESPTVGLLNVGEEIIKGNDTVKQAGDLLRASRLNFFGNVEGDDIFKGTTDVVVCDGFVGNVSLKASEGVAQMLGGFLREEFTRNWLCALSAVVALPVLNHFRKRVDHRRYNGAALLGLRGLVLKSHGAADAFAFECALQHAYDAARHDVLERIATAVSYLSPVQPQPQPASLESAP
jgi:glycerol-3-phosphate acyltransferase PlsX